jgi:hypothetical protein
MMIYKYKYHIIKYSNHRVVSIIEMICRYDILMAIIYTMNKLIRIHRLILELWKYKHVCASKTQHKHIIKTKYLISKSN